MFWGWCIGFLFGFLVIMDFFVVVCFFGFVCGDI